MSGEGFWAEIYTRHDGACHPARQRLGADPALTPCVQDTGPRSTSSRCSCRWDDTEMEYSAKRAKLTQNHSSLFLWACPVFILSFQIWENSVKLDGTQWTACSLSRATNQRTEQNSTLWNGESKKQNRKITMIKKPIINNFSNTCEIFSKEQLPGQVYSLPCCYLPWSLRLSRSRAHGQPSDHQGLI